MPKETPKERLVIPPISTAAPGPLYRQIVHGIKRETAEGRLGPNTALPSYRALAKDLLVSIITVRRAYEELEREGIVYRRQGLGTFIAEDGVSRSREVMSEQTRTLLRRAVEEGTEAGHTGGELLSMLREVLKERKD